MTATIAGAAVLAEPRRRVWPAVVLAAAAVLVQMAFPFTGGDSFVLTAASVVLLSAAAVTHALLTAGVAAASTLVVVAGGGGLVAETVGVRTGVPFGDYAYAGTLGPQLLDVPLLVPLAWVMMAWPAVVVAHVLVGSRGLVLRATVGAWALTAWDVFLDPQMVDDGHWTWTHPSPSLPGVDGIPLTNFAGWLLVSFVVCAALTRAAGRVSDRTLPVAVYLWTYGSSVLAHAVFFGRPSVALVGGLVMGVVAWPLALDAWGRARGRWAR